MKHFTSMKPAVLAFCFVQLLLLSVVSQTTHAKEVIEFKDDVQKTMYQELVLELRCPKCQNQNIADSNAVIARDMRVKTKELLDKGYSKQQVIDYMIDRYGQFAHYQPPMTLATSMLWLLPGAFILFGVVFLIKRAKTQSALTPATVDDKALDEALDQLLDESTASQKPSAFQSSQDKEAK